MGTANPDGLRMTLVYDGDCGICQWSSDWVLKQVPQVISVPSRKYLVQNPEFPDRLRFNHEVMFVDGDEMVYWGPGAILALFWVTGHRVLGWRGWLPLARALYPVIARNRSRISRLFGLKAECKLDP